MRAVIVLAILVLGVACRDTNTYTGTGNVVAVDDAHRHVTIRHDDIPGLMSAMTMRFEVRAPALLDGIAPGARVGFDVVREGEAMVVTRVALAAVIPTTTVRPAAGNTPPGVHDHTPHHGGVVGMTGMIHLEALAEADGRVRVWLTDYWRRPLSLEGVTGSVAVDTPDGEQTHALVARDGALEATGPASRDPEVTVHFDLVRDGEPVEMDFILPVSGQPGGAASVPRRGCVPPTGAPAPGQRLPRCVLEFPRSIAVIAATPDAATALVGVVDTNVTAWRLPAGEFVAGFAQPPPLTLPVGEALHSEAPNAIAVSPDGREAVVALESRLLRYEIGTGRLVRELPRRRGIVRDLAWSPDANALLFSIFYDATVHLVSADDGAERAAFAVEREGAAVAFIPDGHAAVVGSDAGAVTLFAVPGGASLRRLEPARTASTIAVAGSRLVTGASDGALRIWDIATGNLAREIPTGAPVWRIAISPDGTRVASTAFDGVVHVHEIATGRVVETLDWHHAQLLGLAWAGPTLLTGDSRGRVALWDITP
jgi:Cu/Ag efflux protein CusF